MYFKKTGTPFINYPASFPDKDTAAKHCYEFIYDKVDDVLAPDYGELKYNSVALSFLDGYDDVIETLFGDLVPDGSSYEECLDAISDTITLFVLTDYEQYLSDTSSDEEYEYQEGYEEEYE